MTTNPFVNALLASGYITLVATAIWSAPGFEHHLPGPVAPILFLSLFTFSAALMGYLLLFEPVRLLAEGKQGEAGKLLLSTLGALVVITLCVVALGFAVAGLAGK